MFDQNATPTTGPRRFGLPVRAATVVAIALGISCAAVAPAVAATGSGPTGAQPVTVTVVDQATARGGQAHVFSSDAAAAAYVAKLSAGKPVGAGTNTAGATSFDLFTGGSERGYTLHLAGVGTSHNLSEFSVCFLCSNWNDQASSITNGGTPVWLYKDNNRLNSRIVIAPWIQTDLSRYGFDNIASSYYIGANPPS